MTFHKHTTLISTQKCHHHRQEGADWQQQQAQLHACKSHQHINIGNLKHYDLHERNNHIK